MGESEIKNSDDSHWLKIVIPPEITLFNSLCLTLDVQVMSIASLFIDRISCVIQSPLLEILLVTLLHLDDERRTTLTFARNVKNNLPVILCHPVMLRRNKIHLDNLHILQNRIQKAYQHILVRF